MGVVVFILLVGGTMAVQDALRNRPGTVVFPLVHNGWELRYGQIIIADAKTGKIVSPEAKRQEDLYLEFLQGHPVTQDEVATAIRLPAGEYTARFWAGELCTESECIPASDTTHPWGTESFTIKPGQKLDSIAFNEATFNRELEKATEEWEAYNERFIRLKEAQYVAEQEYYAEKPYIFSIGVDLGEIGIRPCAENICEEGEVCIEFPIAGEKTCWVSCDGEHTGPCKEGYCRPVGNEPPLNMAACEKPLAQGDIP